MKILHITDSHATVKSPEGRQDIYYISFLKKLYELGYVIKRNKIDMVIHTGDMFHTPRVSDKFAGQISEIMKSWGVPVYVVPGNHDIDGYSVNTIDQTKLGLLAKTEVINILDRDHPLVINSWRESDGEKYTIAISGQEYYMDIDTGNKDDFFMKSIPNADINILAIHGYIVDKPQHPNIRHTLCKNVITDADIILSGHYHHSFEYNGDDFDVYNPGSMMRVEQDEYNRKHIPQYGILDIELAENGNIEYDYSFHKFKSAQLSEIVFDYNTKYQNNVAAVTLEDFKNSISKTDISSFAHNTENFIKEVCLKNNVNKEICSLVMQYYRDSSKRNEDEFGLKNGFITLQPGKYKKLKSIRLVNFQSHKDTRINFDDGLNIIVGETNEGKTSIFRAIMWVIDNQPLGSDFIRTGEDKCSVTLLFTDGTFIRRSRTRNDTGTYETGNFITINVPNPNNPMQTIEKARGKLDNVYKGFSNNVPVEIDNIHQMPKVNITKDIETHLNVVSQLDAPFLITQSPQVKAAAIGRLAGTHVFDSAVKQCNSKIRDLKKEKKVLDSILTDKEKELNLLPDIPAMKEYFNKLSSVVAWCSSANVLIDKIGVYENKIADISSKILSARKSIEDSRDIIKIKPMVLDTVLFCETISKIETLYTQKERVETDIKDTELRFHTSKAFASFGSFIDNLTELNKSISLMSDYVERYTIMQKSIQDALEQIDVCEKMKPLIAVIEHCQNLINFIFVMSSKMDEYNNIVHTEKAMLDKKAKADKEIKNIKESMIRNKKERIEFVLVNNNICPCCGQIITDEKHVQSVIEYMQENKKGEKK